MSTVQFHCRLSETTGTLPHFWEHAVGGSNTPARGTRADWRAQLRPLPSGKPVSVACPASGVLCDDMGTLMEEDGQLLYSFFNADQIWYFVLSIGMKPFVELSFMPTSLASGNTTVFHYQRPM